ncbi:hypothetical protein ACFOHJ_03915 [Aquamicrobium soli]|uniref:Uncharacterized protein n=1 Tax=Aquamicrobium soli TaxID=1811518 RepID=A0ABV7KD69_9HYPH
MVTNGDGPVALAPGFVEALKARVGSDDVIDFDDGPQLEDTAVSADAPFSNAISSLGHLADQGRVFVLMEFVGPQIPVRAPAINAP